MDPAVEMEEGLSGSTSPTSFSGKQPKVITLNNVNYSVIDKAKNGQQDSKRKTILKDISFYVKPGTMILMLGAPGGGRTSLFKVMANLTAAGSQLDGDLLFGGKHISPHLHHKQVAYITQEDNHLPSLTVRETLWFSSECSLGPSSVEEQNERMEKLLKILSLKHVENTYIGNQFLRGISGGQKKRVTVGLDLLKGANVLLMDEPTTGLDSVTVVELITCIQSLAHSTGVSVICTLLQPPAEVLPLFDQLLLLNGGEVSYFGPLQDARPYFNNLGFEAIDDNEAEFFQEVVSTPADFVMDGSGVLQPDQPQNPSEFASVFKNSPEYQTIQSVINENHVTTPPHSKKNRKKTEYVNPFWRQIYLCVWRAWKMAARDRMALYSRFFTTIFQGFYFGLSFLFTEDTQTGAENIQSMLFISSMYTTFSTMITLEDLYNQRPVFNEQRRSRKWYRALPYFIAYSSTEFVLGFLQSVLLCVIMYWLTGLSNGEGRFVYLVLNHYFLYLSNFAILFANSAITSTSFYPGVIIPVSQLGFLILNGYAIARNQIPGWWIWLHWALPTTYSYEGMMINEFGGRNLRCEADELVPPLAIANAEYQGSQICPVTHGEQILRDKGFQTDFYFRWVDLVILMAFTALFLFIAYLAILFTYQSTTNASGVVAKKKKHKKAKKDTPQEPKHSKHASGCELTFTDVSYYVNVKGRKLQLLHNVSGFVEPGKLLALMGPSGAGKSTLLDVLAQRKRHGTVEGEILIGGRKVDNTFLRRAAYVMQTDILHTSDTVREVVRFSAACRLPRHHDAAYKNEFAEGVLRDMKLDKIGNELVATLSPEQKKRVNIAVELAANPQILFLDEPTSGLDSAGARNVMKCVHAVSTFCRRNASCSIICTIHQPSEEIFSLFDSLLLMATGGYTVYFGPLVDEQGGNRNNALLDHCKSAGYTMDPGTNPADFILAFAAAKPSKNDTSEVQVDSVQGLFSHYNKSKLSENNKSVIGSLITSALALPISVVHPAASFITQTLQCLWRASRGFNRRRTELIYQSARSVLFALFLGTLYLRLDTDQWGATQSTSAIFFAIAYGSLMGYTLIPVCNAERSVFYKEKDSGTYPPLAYCAAQIMASSIVNAGLSVIFVLPIFWLAGIDPNDGFTSFLFYVLAYYISSSCFVTVGQLCAVALPSQGAAAIVFCVIEQIAILYGGFLIKTKSMVGGLSWLRYISFYKYSVESTSVQVLSGVDFYCKDSEFTMIPLPDGTLKEYCPFTRGEQILEMNSFDEAWKWPDIGILIGEWLVLMVLFYLALKKIRYD